jgi:hypothetical protein
MARGAGIEPLPSCLETRPLSRLSLWQAARLELPPETNVMHAYQRNEPTRQAPLSVSRVIRIIDGRNHRTGLSGHPGVEMMDRKPHHTPIS